MPCTTRVRNASGISSIPAIQGSVEAFGMTPLLRAGEALEDDVADNIGPHPNHAAAE
jgi:hypothetical protein